LIKGVQQIQINLLAIMAQEETVLIAGRENWSSGRSRVARMRDVSILAVRDILDVDIFHG
jgi:hypothetical protein